MKFHQIFGSSSCESDIQLLDEEADMALDAWAESAKSAKKFQTIDWLFKIHFMEKNYHLLEYLGIVSLQREIKERAAQAAQGGE